MCLCSCCWHPGCEEASISETEIPVVACVFPYEHDEGNSIIHHDLPYMLHCSSMNFKVHLTRSSNNLAFVLTIIMIIVQETGIQLKKLGELLILTLTQYG